MKTIAQVWGGAVLKIVVKYNIINHNFSYLFFVMCEKSFVPIVFFSSIMWFLGELYWIQSWPAPTRHTHSNSARGLEKRDMQSFDKDTNIQAIIN